MSAPTPRLLLNSGVRIPQIGFGTFQIPPSATAEAVSRALEIGYRHIDTAAGYYNEAGVGEAIRSSGLDRDALFVTTKLRNADQGRESARRALASSLEELGLDRVDLYLIHWPVPARDLYLETWEALIELRDEGLASSIGVANFLPEHLDRIVEATGVIPAVDQVEAHPLFHRPALRERCVELGIAIEAYSPLGQGRDLAEPTVAGIAEAHGVSPAEVVLAWHVARGHVAIPKTVNAERMALNLRAASLHLGAAELGALDALHSQEGRVGGDPATFAFPQTLEDMKARGESLED
ncbi:aldo/keto reductase [Schaalia hyovaginalis]|uniref:Diketogulonate reductase-like aldo/keto reductase n=1 Tax=Schaalia hyovaginalis TaxID=29316 RepID=A0A923E3Z8_9ACTO|nr:aldo/keto reductase [Schaalia hyovaginalis]MBB6334352.1 diketogulonate reductase-like aldo/keto reductase [Schaalia hyovaginalis]